MAKIEKPAMVKHEATGLEMVEATGLVPCVIDVSEAGFGLRAGEARGLPPNVAAAMIKRGSAKLLYPAAK